MENNTVIDEQPKYEESKKQTIFESKSIHDYNTPSVWSVVLIVIGSYFLLSNFNIISSDLVQGILRAWPALLVFWGIDLYTKDKPKIRRSAMVVLVMLVVFLILTY